MSCWRLFGEYEPSYIIGESIDQSTVMLQHQLTLFTANLREILTQAPKMITYKDVHGTFAL